MCDIFSPCCFYVIWDEILYEPFLTKSDWMRLRMLNGVTGYAVIMTITFSENMKLKCFFSLPSIFSCSDLNSFDNTKQDKHFFPLSNVTNYDQFVKQRHCGSCNKYKTCVNWTDMWVKCNTLETDVMKVELNWSDRLFVTYWHFVLVCSLWHWKRWQNLLAAVQIQQKRKQPPSLHTCTNEFTLIGTSLCFLRL